MTTPTPPYPETAIERLIATWREHAADDRDARGWSDGKWATAANDLEALLPTLAQERERIEQDQWGERMLAIAAVTKERNELRDQLATETQARQLAESQKDALQSQFDRMSELAQSQTQARQEAEKENERLRKLVIDGKITACETKMTGDPATCCCAECCAYCAQELRDALTAEREARQQAARTVASIAAMLGWGNVPTQRALEDNLRALKARLEQAELERDEAKLIVNLYKNGDRSLEALRTALETAIEKWTPQAICYCSIHCDCDASGYETCITDVRLALSAAQAREPEIIVTASNPPTMHEMHAAVRMAEHHGWTRADISLADWIAKLADHDN